MRSIQALITAATATAMVSTAAAQSETQTRALVWDDANPLPSVSFDTFDTMGGTRELTGASFRLVGTMAYEITVQNFDPVEYAAGTWSVESNYQALLAVGDEGPGLGFGGIGIESLTGDLGAGEGSNPFNGIPGDPAVVGSTSGDIDSTQSLRSADFEFVLTGPSVSVLYLPFTEFLITPPPGVGFINAFASSLSIDADIELTYTYVPAPAGIAVLGFAGLTATRRRR